MLKKTLMKKLENLPDDYNIKIQDKHIVFKSILSGVFQQSRMPKLYFYSFFILWIVLYHLIPVMQTTFIENKKIKQQITWSNKTKEMVNVIYNRSPAVGGMINALYNDILDNTSDIQQRINELPKTDLAIIIKEKTLNYGLSLYNLRLNDMVFPVQNIDKSWITNEYGYIYTKFISNRSHKLTGYYRHHRGIDIVCRTNYTVISTYEGMVLKIGHKDKYYGNYIVIQHTNKHNNYRTFYAHLDSIDVSEKQALSKGDRIGIMGTTGNSFGVHLHFELWKKDKKWKCINPLINSCYNIRVSDQRYKPLVKIK